MSEGLPRPVIGPAYFIHWKAHPVETTPRDDRYGQLTLLEVKWRAILTQPHAPGRNGYFPQGIAFPLGYVGREINLKVLSPTQRRHGIGPTLLRQGLEYTGGHAPARAVGGLRNSEVYISQTPRVVRLAFDRMIWEVAVAKSNSLERWLTYVLPRLGVAEQDVAAVSRELLSLIGR